MSKYALFSLTDKSNLDVLVSGLARHNFKFIGTTSTAKAIRDLGYECTSVEDITNFPEMLDGRVKTLQPEIAGGILADLNKQSHIDDLKKNNINPISIVVCNLYEFAQTVEVQQVRFDNNEITEDEMDKDIIEHIDIGGITLLRASAKNYRHVSLLCDPNDYEEYINRLDNDEVNIAYRSNLATKGFITSANYDSMIANYFMDKKQTKEQLLISAPLKEALRYGENPHQSAMFYEDNKKYSYSLNTSQVLQGKQLSYNNMLDIDAAYQTIREFNEPTAIALKHNTPCGAGFDEDILKAYHKCFASDPVSIFGGVVIFNREVTYELALELTSIFLEIVIAPSFTKEALEQLATKKNLRVIIGDFSDKYNRTSMRSISGGYLVQEEAIHSLDDKSVTTLQASKSAISILTNLYRLVKNVKSNAIVVGNTSEVLGISGGMVSRVDALKFALSKAVMHESYTKQEELYIASDGFFPFNDVIDYALEYNIKYIIQPGGSINDEKLINACNENGITMIFTQIRYFKH